ncbi:hypothetical protein Anas_07974, partial [Armadillidium nasatum]
ISHTEEIKTRHPQIRAFIYDQKKRVKAISITVFKRANMFIKYKKKVVESIPKENLECGQFLPSKLLWNTTGCTLNITEESCTCSCFGLDGWIGFISNDYSKSMELLLNQNYIVTAGCIVSAFLLTVTIVMLLIRCGFWSTKLLTNVIECLALMIANVVFISCSVIKTSSGDQ